MNKGKVYRVCPKCSNIVTFNIVNAIKIEEKTYCKICRKKYYLMATKEYVNGEMAGLIK